MRGLSNIPPLSSPLHCQRTTPLSSCINAPPLFPTQRKTPDTLMLFVWFSSVQQLGNKRKRFTGTYQLLMQICASLIPGGDKLPSPPIKHPCSSSKAQDLLDHRWSCEPLTLPGRHHSNDSLAKINQKFWTALYPLLRCVTDVRQTWLQLSPWRMPGWLGLGLMPEFLLERLR